jgi:hypothetical protein
MLTAGQTVRRPCTALAHNAQSRAELTQVILYVESNPTMVKSITNFPYIAKSL